MSDTCSICKQPFLEGEGIDPAVAYLGIGQSHQYASDCFAAAVRRCEWIVRNYHGDADIDKKIAEELAGDIREEFPDAFQDAERLRGGDGK